MSLSSRPYLLPETAVVDDALRRAVERDYERFAHSGPPASLTDYVTDAYEIDLTADYAGFELSNPWGKASGQLSMTARQVAEDVEAGLAFVVLKTVIAEDAAGGRAMQAWAVREARMLAERIVGQSGEAGWTISWKGRGWWQSFDEYLTLIREARQIARGTGTLIVPSCKYHLPTPDEAEWKVDEYRDTTPRLIEAWRADAEDAGAPMPLEKDFSPTLAGSGRSAEQKKIIEWLQTVPRLVRDGACRTGTPARRYGRDGQECSSYNGAAAIGAQSAHGGWRMDDGGSKDGQSPAPSSPVRLGLKIFNALFDDEFQLEMLRAIHQPQEHPPDFFIYGNRLFDPQREFEGHQGIAVGGPDLSDRNLRVMGCFQQEAADNQTPLLPWSATGNITTGKLALEYALRGASSFQLHTFFQLPADQYRMTAGSKIQKALHELYFHPQTGFILWLHHVARKLGLAGDRVRFRDVVGRGRGGQESA